MRHTVITHARPGVSMGAVYASTHDPGQLQRLVSACRRAFPDHAITLWRRGVPYGVLEGMRSC